MKMAYALLMVSALVFVSFAMGNDQVCRQGDAERKIQVRYEAEGKKIPCQVVYQKESSEEKTLWSAQNQEGYCEDRAREFTEKLASMGWQCAGGDKEPASENK